MTVVSEMEAVELAASRMWDDRSGDQKTYLLCAQYRDRFHTDGAREHRRGLVCRLYIGVRDSAGEPDRAGDICFPIL